MYDRETLVHDAAYTNVKSNFIFQEDAAKLILKIINKKVQLTLEVRPKQFMNLPKNIKNIKKISSKGEFPYRTDMVKEIKRIIKT